MVNMIPDIISADVKSDAEKSLFFEFQNYSGSENYIILHSLGLSEHIHNIFGEIDFVIICSKGVLCVEVKGGAVSCSQGKWMFTNRYQRTQTKNEGPFQQAQGNMHSLRTYLKKRLGKDDPLVRCQYACCVVMPDCEFTYDGIEIINEILFDKRSYSGLDALVEQSFRYWSDIMEERHGFRCEFLSDNESARLSTLLRGDFRFVPSMKSRINATAKELHALTNEQYEVLESLEDNKRTLVSGVAGAGKTLLAIEQTRRMYWAGKSVLYICYNKNVASYVQFQFKRESMDVQARTLHSLLLELCGDENDCYDSDFFGNVLPERFILSNELKYTYDYIIIDEGQDLLKEKYLRCLDKMLVGGLSGGSWLIFYDQNQNIYNANNEMEDCLEELKNKAASFRLSINCRNTKQIADANTLTTGIANIGKPKVNGMSVNYDYYVNKDDEYRKLIDIILDLKNEGIVGNDFVILSKYNINNMKNCLHGRQISKNLGLLKTKGEMWNSGKNDIRIATISAFKGLEAKIVILIDVDDFSSEEIRLLNYVAISRASTKLYILYDKAKEDQRQQMLVFGFRKL